MRIVIAAVASAVIVFMWGFLSWGLLQIWSGQVQNLPDDERVTAVLMDAIPADGAYFFPPMPADARSADSAVRTAAQEAWAEKHRRGPIGMVLINRAGKEPMAPKVFIAGLATNFLNGILLAIVVSAVARSGANFGTRFFVGVAVALFAVLSTHVSNWNWFHFPADWTMAVGVDHLIGWGIAAVVTALIVVDTRQVAPIG